MTAARPARAPRLAVLASLLMLGLTACDQKTPTSPTKPLAASAAAKPRRCPDPDIRDAHDPCSVAYVRRAKPRFSDRDPLP